MARENYSYNKFQREMAQKKKRLEKLQRKQDKKNQGTAPLEQGGVSSEAPAE